MKLPLAILFASVALAQSAHYRTGQDGARLPDKKVTPGAVRTRDAADVCATKTSTVRNVTESEKKAVYTAYGIKPKPGVCCEVDHLISLELGGSNEIGNLWPQPYSPRPGAHEKDVLENALHKQVCAGKIKLVDAQRQIADDWYTLYQKLGLGK